ncbi:MAG: Pr6Pr family membrane protein [Erythrobacter sp.]|jgi:hypothetical protein
MDRQASTPSRALAAIIAVAIVGALGLQTAINAGRDEESPLVAFALLLRFFTIWSNVAAALVMTWLALGRRVPQPVLFALATALAIVALVYWVLLAVDHHPVGPDRLTNQLFHSFAPAATIGWWLAFAPPHPITRRSLPVVMIAPVLYTGFALANGALTGFYPYFFLDRTRFGWLQLATNIIGLALFFLAMGGLLLGFKRLVSARA